MSEFKFRDYDVRVWDEDVFINSHDVIDYASGSIDRGLQINTHNEAARDKVMNLCNNITSQFIELNYILDDIGKDNEENGE